MTDISMCNRSDCGKKDTCFRYLADADEYQSYIIQKKLNLKDGCDMYWMCRNMDELKYMNRVNR